MKTPILLVAYKRPETTKKVLAAIGRVKPSTLYVSLNIPRPNALPAEIEACREVELLFSQLPWDCKVRLNKWPEHRSAGQSIYGAISWVFEQEERAIILEDDCVPDLTFFRYCDELLEKYQDDSRIMLISGSNINTTWQRGGYSYHFARFGGIHGWASWRRAWQKVDLDIALWQDPRTKELLKGRLGAWQFYFLSKIYDKLVNQSKNVHTWDYQFDFARFVNSGLAIVPSTNLVTNVGFGQDSTHTSDKNCKAANLKLVPLQFPLVHPLVVIEDTEYDKLVKSILFPMTPKVFLSAIKHRAKRLMQKLLGL